MSWEEQLTGWNFGLDREIKRLCAQMAVDAIKRFNCEPDSYAWRCWWETILREEITCAWIPIKPCDRAIGSDGEEFVPEAIKDSVE